ncbi:hypothetical protein CRYUN_Cryun02cG0143500 [Craigia yunnanensis]
MSTKSAGWSWMEFNFFIILILLNVSVLSHADADATLPAEVYWKSVFPHTPIPKALKHLLLPPPPQPPPPAGGNKNLLFDTMKLDDSDNDGDYGNADPSRGFGRGNISPTNKTIYFFENDLHPGKKMKLEEFGKARNGTRFLSRRVAETIPFSSDKFPGILNLFSLKPESKEAKVMNRTLANCERPAIEGEDKCCATSLESFVDFSVSKFGRNIQVLSSEVETETENQEFSIGNKGMKMMGEKEIVCHKMKYPYAVFLCHSLDKTAVYKVPLVGKDGTKAKALAVCHKDTSAWNPNHMAFRVLKVKPGTVPICHFLMRDNLVWVPN